MYSCKKVILMQLYSECPHYIIILCSYCEYSSSTPKLYWKKRCYFRKKDKECTCNPFDTYSNNNNNIIIKHHDTLITTALVLSTRDWGMAGSKVKLTGWSVAFMKRAWGEFSQKRNVKGDKCCITWTEISSIANNKWTPLVPNPWRCQIYRNDIILHR